MRRISVAVVPTALLAVLAGACAPAARHASAAPVPATDPGGPRAVRTSPSAIAKARADSARLPWTAADAHFMAAMIHHHAQAIAMSRMAPSHGASPAVLRLADRIINAQQDEIATMQQWLADRRQPVPEPTPGPMKMMMGGMEHDMLMPGMLTEEQMRELDAARGTDFDRVFLTYMIQHHRGAVSMVQDLFNSYGAAQDETVFKFANDVNVDQTTEIARMEKMLATAKLGWTNP
ncbi:MAG TPA: DUF305 domain-containing protein [Gemmatimonadaceae bacterium]|nr:DUF305 domain-containing protein [Gemmatimonadaceae bacterium]